MGCFGEGNKRHPMQLGVLFGWICAGGWKIENLFPMFARKNCEFDDSQHNLPRISVWLVCLFWPILDNPEGTVLLAMMCHFLALQNRLWLAFSDLWVFSNPPKTSYYHTKSLELTFLHIRRKNQPKWFSPFNHWNQFCTKLIPSPCWYFPHRGTLKVVPCWQTPDLAEAEQRTCRWVDSPHHQVEDSNRLRALSEVEKQTSKKRCKFSKSINYRVIYWYLGSQISITLNHWDSFPNISK